MSKGMFVPRLDDDCALCRARVANETGSHLVPNFIIHKAFAYDGEGKRDHEISYLEHLNDDAKTTYYARGVRGESITADLGHEMTDEEIENNVNNLVYDNLFCKECEKRFGVLETEYAKLYTNGQTANPRIAYLFWLSVFWRMSVGYMAMTLDIHDELEIRKILDGNLGERDDMANSDADLGNFGYIVYRCPDVQKGDSGVFASRSTGCQYIIIANDLVVALVRDNKRRYNIAHKVVKSDYVNSWSEEDIYVEEISLETFARFKRWILDQSYNMGYGPQREKVERHLLELCRHENTVEKWDDNEELIDCARMDDAKENPVRPMLRNMRRFWVAELKATAAKRIGREYSLLRDRSLMLFQFDVDNYRSDLINYSRHGQFISHLPMARQIVPHKYWADEGDDAPTSFDYEATIDDMLSRGYTYEDILDHNCCHNSSLENA